MAQITCDTPRSRDATGVVGALLAWWRRVRRESEIRDAIRLLNSLDDRLLDDIGLPRDDIVAGVRGMRERNRRAR